MWHAGLEHAWTVGLIKKKKKNSDFWLKKWVMLELLLMGIVWNVLWMSYI